MSILMELKNRGVKDIFIANLDGLKRFSEAIEAAFPHARSTHGATMQPHFSPWQAVFFDFDGVIAASIEVKVNAFATLFAPYGPKVQEAVIRYHRENGGMPRQQKLRYCFETLAGKAIDDQDLVRMGQTFSDLVLEKVVAAPLIPGVLSTLRHLREYSIPAFVVSGTPHDEMQLIVARKGLQPYFTEVHGSPQTKAAIVREILGRYHYRPHHCLFIGDALADYRAATDTGLHFLGITPEGQPSLFPEGVTTASKVTLNFATPAAGSAPLFHPPHRCPPGGSA